MAKKSKTKTISLEELFGKYDIPVKKRKKKTIVEEVMDERNLVVAPIEPLTAPVVNETQHGIVRIEGEVTPEKLQLARQFETIFTQATEEILDLAAYTPNENVREFVRKSGLTQEQTQNMLKASPWTVFTVKGESLMKTPDNKLETVKNYCYRLEQAVINVARTKNSELKDRTEAFNTLKSDFDLLQKRQALLEGYNRDLKNTIFDLRKSTTSLSFKSSFSKLKTLIISLFKRGV